MKIFDFKQFRLQCPDNHVHPMGTDSWLLGAISDIPTFCLNLLDIGTGTGIVALMLAQRTQKLDHPPMIYALDIDQITTMVAEENFRSAPWSTRMITICEDINTFVATVKFDLIVCNPPFFLEDTTSKSASRRRNRQEQNLSIPDLVKSVKLLLAETGVFWLIAPLPYAKQFEETANTSKLYCNKIIKVFSDHEKKLPIRVLMKYTFTPFAFERDDLYIYKKHHEYTSQTQKILADFFTQ